LGDELEKRRLLVRPGSFGFTLYPPLIINRDEVNELLEKMDESFSATHKLFF
jgi:adenosylmethionine-8-amino-7-oxononanoate aminotransferase